MDTRRLKAAVEHYQKQLGRALTDKEMQALERSIAGQSRGTTVDMSTDKVSNLVNLTKKLEDQHREQEKQDRRERAEKQRKDDVDNLAKLGGRG